MIRARTTITFSKTMGKDNYPMTLKNTSNSADDDEAEDYFKQHAYVFPSTKDNAILDNISIALKHVGHDRRADLHN
ncbi:hypothetical protein RIF29_40985 [Crotalaria pallida]|uniref:Uncharacterized protein n=1 Tax=Crotalaria pallida TaxID=3830 RepID=A0AAN9E4V5_CROPI